MAGGYRHEHTVIGANCCRVPTYSGEGDKAKYNEMKGGAVVYESNAFFLYSRSASLDARKQPDIDKSLGEPEKMLQTIRALFNSTLSIYHAMSYQMLLAPEGLSVLTVKC